IGCQRTSVAPDRRSGQGLRRPWRVHRTPLSRENRAAEEPATKLTGDTYLNLKRPKHFSLFVLPILILFPSFAFSTPSKLAEVEGRFLGSNKEGSTYFILTEVSQYYEEGWGWSYSKNSWSIQEFRNAGGDEFTKIERPLMSLEESSGTSDFE